MDETLCKFNLTQMLTSIITFYEVHRLSRHSYQTFVISLVIKLRLSLQTNYGKQSQKWP